MQKAKSLISLNPSILSCLFFVAEILYNPERCKEILKDIFTASSLIFHPIQVAMDSNQPSGWIEPLLLKTRSLKNKRIR